MMEGKIKYGGAKHPQSQSAHRVWLHIRRIRNVQVIIVKALNLKMNKECKGKKTSV